VRYSYIRVYEPALEFCMKAYKYKYSVPRVKGKLSEAYVL